MKRVLFLFLSLCFFSCDTELKNDKPNVILIMADDIGLEALGVNGAVNYQTPVLDSLARNGINFINAYSQPLCSPSRVKIMTGKPNYVNYEYFTYLNPSQDDLTNNEAERYISLSLEKYCSVGSTINDKTTINHSFEIIR